MPRLLRLMCRKSWPMPGDFIGPMPREVSPEGGSILITSAPKSPSSCVQNGPISTWVRSITRTPVRGP